MPLRAVVTGLFIGSLGAGVVLVRAHLEERPAALPVIETFEPPAPGSEEDLRLAALGDLSAGPEEPAPEPEAAVVEVEPEPPSPDRLSADALLAALGKETVVYEKPTRESRQLGFLRTGAVVQRAPVPKSKDGCSAGWYRVAPEGFVCVGRTATLDLDHPTIALASGGPNRAAPLPYVYGKAAGAPPPFYARLPSREEQEAVEKDLAVHRTRKLDPFWTLVASDAPPMQIAGGERIPRPFGYPVLPRGALIGHGLANSAFSFVDVFETEGRRWGISTDLTLIPLDRLIPVETSKFQGVILGDGVDLPLVFVRSRKAQLYRGDPEAGALEPERPVAYREAFGLTGRSQRVGRDVYLETTGGYWLPDRDLSRIDRLESLPHWAKERRTWIDVSVVHQTLVAYEGDKPVYATLVSTGKDRLGDPQTTHSTARGLFRIHTKHVTATMSGDEPGDEFDLRDIPYVQYFHEGFALHAAFWHDSFGTPRSHGCINLAPLDARWLFSWTEPPVPQQWHTAFSLLGTLIHVRP